MWGPPRSREGVACFEPDWLVVDEERQGTLDDVHDLVLGVNMEWGHLPSTSHSLHDGKASASLCIGRPDKGEDGSIEGMFRRPCGCNGRAHGVSVPHSSARGKAASPRSKVRLTEPS